MDKGFITPPGHNAFLAKKLFDGLGEIKWGALAYIEPGGGGPQGNHAHPEAHIFIVVSGEATVMLENEAHKVAQDECFFVPGNTDHSIWNCGSAVCKVIKISVDSACGNC